MAEYTEQQLIGALRKADAAGDVEAARAIAKRIQAMRQPQQWKPTQRSVEDLRAMAGDHDATEGMTFGQRFTAGMGKSLVDTGRGIKQLVGLQGREDVDRQRELDADLMDDGAGIAGNVTGVVGQFLLPGGVLKGASYIPKLQRAASGLNTASRAFMPTTVRGAAAAGGAAGLVQPVATGESRAMNTAAGTSLGGIGAAAPKAVGGLYRLLRGNGVTAKGAERKIAEILRMEASNAENLARSAPSAVPGVQRTLAEESLDPGISRLERLLRSKTRGWDELDSRNNAARVGALREFAGDDGAVRAAMAERDAMAAPFLRAAQKHTGVDTSRLVSQLDRAQELFSGRPAVQSTLRDVQGLLYRPATAAEKRASQNWPDQVLRDEVGQLYNVRKTLGDLMSGKLAGEKPAAQAATRELMMARNGLDRAIAKETPMFRGYLEAYKQGSRAVDRHKLGQHLIDRGAGGAVPDAATGLPVLTPAGFSRQANNLDAAAAGATGFRKARADNILEPEDFATIEAIQDDLSRRAFAATKGSGGNSQTFERFAGEGRLRGRLIQAVPLVREAAAMLDDAAKARLERTLAEVLQDPSRARDILARIPAQERRIVENAFTLAGATGGSSLVPAVE